MKRARPILFDGDGAPRSGLPPLAAPTTFQDDEIRVAEWLIQDAAKRNVVAARSDSFASFARKMQGLRKRVENNRAVRTALLPAPAPATEGPYVPAAGEVDGPTLSRLSEPREPIPGDPEPRQRSGRPRGVSSPARASQPPG